MNINIFDKNYAKKSAVDALDANTSPTAATKAPIEDVNQSATEELKESEEKTQEKSEAPTDTLGRFKKFHIQ